MNRPAHTLAVTLIILAAAITASAEDRDQKDSGKLPAELTTDVDVFERTLSIRAFTFPPFKVTGFQHNVDTDDAGQDLPLPGYPGPGSPGSAVETDLSFTLQESDRPQWECQCQRRQSGAFPLSGQITLRCDFAKPGGDPVWWLDQKMKFRSNRLKPSITEEGRLFSEAVEFEIAPLIETSKVFGDKTAGYLFKSGEATVAGAVFRNRFPTRIVIRRSVASADRSILMAAYAALSLSGVYGNR